MSRQMGDATHANVPQLAAVPGLQLVAGYVTGTTDIRWTAEDWAVFTVPGIFQIAIDQGGIGSPVDWAHVRDVEQFAWTVPAAVDRTGWTAARPTIYCNRNTLPAVLAAGWRGDLWIAMPGWQPGDPLPSTPGCTVVAVQNDYSSPAYDLSIVLDPAWPGRKDPAMACVLEVQGGGAYLLDGGKMVYISQPADLGALSAQLPVITISAAGGPQFLAGFPPGQPAVSVSIPALNISTTGTVTRA